MGCSASTQRPGEGDVTVTFVAKGAEGKLPSFEPTAPATTFDKMGGEKALVAVVETFCERVFTDERLLPELQVRCISRRAKVARTLLLRSQAARGGPAFRTATSLYLDSGR